MLGVFGIRTSGDDGSPVRHEEDVVGLVSEFIQELLVLAIADADGATEALTNSTKNVLWTIFHDDRCSLRRSDASEGEPPAVRVGLLLFFRNLPAEHASGRGNSEIESSLTEQKLAHELREFLRAVGVQPAVPPLVSEQLQSLLRSSDQVNCSTLDPVTHEFDSNLEDGLIELTNAHLRGDLLLLAQFREDAGDEIGEATGPEAVGDVHMHLAAVFNLEAILDPVPPELFLRPFVVGERAVDIEDHSFLVSERPRQRKFLRVCCHV